MKSTRRGVDRRFVLAVSTTVLLQVSLTHAQHAQVENGSAAATASSTAARTAAPPVQPFTTATVPLEQQIHRFPTLSPANGHHDGWPMTVTGEPGHGITARTEDDRFAFTLRGRFMLRDTVLVDPPDATGVRNVINEVSVRRARVVLSGHTFSPNVQYYMQLSLSNQDLESDQRVPLLDAYVTLTHVRDLNVRIGQFITPFDRARVISSSSAQMVDRSIVVGELNLDRDVGVQLFSNDFLGLGGVLSYQFGLFGGEGRNRLQSSHQPFGLLYIARIQVNPFGKFDDYSEGDLSRARCPRLSIGLGAAYNQNTNRQRSTTGSVFQNAFDYVHAEADVMFKFAGFSLLAEVLYRNAHGARRGVVIEGGTQRTEWTRSAWGYFVQAGYMFTDHFEAAARWSQLLPIAETDPRLHTEHELGSALSWYFHGHTLKLQGDYFYLWNDNFDAGRHQARLQAQVSF